MNACNISQNLNKEWEKKLPETWYPLILFNFLLIWSKLEFIHAVNNYTDVILIDAINNTYITYMCLTRFACRFTSSLFLGERFVFIKKNHQNETPKNLG